MEENVYIYGAGSFAKRLKSSLEYRGINVISHVISDQLWTKDNTSSYPLSSITPQGNEVIIVGIFNPDVDLREIFQTLSRSGFKNIIMPWDMIKYLGFNIENYWMNAFLEQAPDAELIYKTRSLLSDNDSIELFDQIVSFRREPLLEYLPNPSLDDQYSANGLFSRRNFSTLVDGGAFTGDSIKDLLAANFYFDEILAFEPNPQNLDILWKNLNDVSLRKIVFPLALGKEQSYLKISLQGAGSSITDSAAGHIIQTVALDSVVANHEIDFIKLDVEGFEMEALLGMRKTIQRYRPMIAISVYHKPNDIYDILGFLNGLIPDRNASIRQHRFNFFDTVLYWNYD